MGFLVIGRRCEETPQRLGAWHRSVWGGISRLCGRRLRKRSIGMAKLCRCALGHGAGPSQFRRILHRDRVKLWVVAICVRIEALDPRGIPAYRHHECARFFVQFCDLLRIVRVSRHPPHGRQGHWNGSGICLQLLDTPVPDLCGRQPILACVGSAGSQAKIAL